MTQLVLTIPRETGRHRPSERLSGPSKPAGAKNLIQAPHQGLSPAMPDRSDGVGAENLIRAPHQDLFPQQ
jgi:hypothetical protein